MNLFAKKLIEAGITTEHAIAIATAIDALHLSLALLDSKGRQAISDLTSKLPLFCLDQNSMIEAGVYKKYAKEITENKNQFAHVFYNLENTELTNFLNVIGWDNLSDVINKFAEIEEVLVLDFIN